MVATTDPATLDDVIKVASGVIGGGGLFKLLDWWSGRKKINAEVEASLETAINSRVTMMIDGLVRHVEYLTDEVKRLSDHIEHQDREIVSLRKALDERPKHQPQIGF